MKKHIISLFMAVVITTSAPVLAGVEHQRTNPNMPITFVYDDPWQPEGFVNGTPVPATWLPAAEISVDGDDGDAAWKRAIDVEVPLYFGSVERAWVKAAYTDEEVFIRVRWADATESREHHPWVWNTEMGSFVEGAQVEDSVMLSFEAGCEWSPSLLAGYSYDFDAWQWMAARSDPLDQAVDLYGNVRMRALEDSEWGLYESRVTDTDWNLKFIENHDVNLVADWDELDRVYMRQPVVERVSVRAVPDGAPQVPPFFERLAPPAEPADDSQVYPQYSPVKLADSAAEVSAKGQWKDGYWTVEFSRARETPVGHIYDTIFNRLVQFSVHVFDQVEALDQASESGRLFLRFLPKEQQVARQ